MNCQKKIGTKTQVKDWDGKRYQANNNLKIRMTIFTAVDVNFKTVIIIKIKRDILEFLTRFSGNESDQHT